MVRYSLGADIFFFGGGDGPLDNLLHEIQQTEQI